MDAKQRRKANRVPRLQQRAQTVKELNEQLSAALNDTTRLRETLATVRKEMNDQRRQHEEEVARLMETSEARYGTAEGAVTAARVAMSKALVEAQKARSQRDEAQAEYLRVLADLKYMTNLRDGLVERMEVMELEERDAKKLRRRLQGRQLELEQVQTTLSRLRAACQKRYGELPPLPEETPQPATTEIVGWDEETAELSPEQIEAALRKAVATEEGQP